VIIVYSAEVSDWVQRPYPNYCKLPTCSVNWRQGFLFGGTWMALI